MKFINHLKGLFQRWGNYYWAVPSITALGIMCLLPLMLALDNEFFQNISEGLFVGYSAEAARLILSSICTALMTVIGVLFSITIVVIQQASAQYSPRVVEVFIKSRNSQFVLGLYVGTFIYGILLLRQIPSMDNGDGLKIPQSAISLGIILSLICISFLVQYVHYITHAIKSTNIIRSIVGDALAYLKDQKEFAGRHHESKSLFNLNHRQQLKAKSYGYFQGYHPEEINDVLGRVERSTVSILPFVGEYLLSGETIAEVKSTEPLSSETIEDLQKIITIGPERTNYQDVRFSLRQLVDISLRALSPGINDPSTAIEALNGISVILTEWMKLPSPPEIINLKRGNQLKVPVISLDIMLEQSFAQVILSAKGHYQVLQRILETLHSTIPLLKTEKDQLLIRSYIEAVQGLLNESTPRYILRKTDSNFEERSIQ